MTLCEGIVPHSIIIVVVSFDLSSQVLKHLYQTIDHSTTIPLSHSTKSLTISHCSISIVPACL